MKVEKVGQPFVPVVISLDSQEELDIFTEVFYRVGGNRFSKYSSIYCNLKKLGGKVTDDGSVEGNIDLKIIE